MRHNATTWVNHASLEAKNPNSTLVNVLNTMNLKFRL